MYFCIMINHTAKRVNFHIDILLSFLDISWQTQDVLKFFTYFTLISFKIFQILVRKDRINSCTSFPQNTIYQDFLYSLYSTQISIYIIQQERLKFFTYTYRQFYSVARTLPIKTATQRPIYRIARTLPMKTATLNYN